MLVSISTQLCHTFSITFIISIGFVRSKQALVLVCKVSYVFIIFIERISLNAVDCDSIALILRWFTMLMERLLYIYIWLHYSASVGFHVGFVLFIVRSKFET
jgi:hypothetical protein